MGWGCREVVAREGAGSSQSLPHSSGKAVSRTLISKVTERWTLPPGCP